jgi:hypothetical protein
VLRLSDLNLPNNTRLNVYIDRRPVGALFVAGGMASTDLPVPFLAGRLSRLSVTLDNGAPVLEGKSPWEVPWPAPAPAP